MKAHSSQRRPMQGPRQPTQANKGHSAAIDDRYVFFLIYILFFIFYITTKPTKAHSSQRRPTQAKAGQWWPPRPPSALHNHQRVTTTCWWFPRPIFLPLNHLKFIEMCKVRDLRVPLIYYL